MARIKFKIGSTPGVHFNLPSREFGNSEICIGKVTVDSGKLKSSGEYSIERQQLVNLVENSRKMISGIQGDCEVFSACKQLEIRLSMTPRGHIKVAARMAGFEFAQPENREWNSESTFYLYPEAMQDVLESESAICS